MSAASPHFFATASEMLDIYLLTIVAVRPGQLAAPLGSRQEAIHRQQLRTPVRLRSTMTWQWRCEFGHLAARDRRN